MFTSTEQSVIFILLMAVFAYQGYKRGFIAEIIKLALVLLGIAVGRPALLGNTVVQAVNGIYFTFLFLVNGGLNAILSGSFGPDDLTAIFNRIADEPALISTASRGLTLFFLMLFLIVVGYAVSSRLRRRAAPALGLVVGAINGLVLAYIFLPALPGEIPILSTAERVELGGGLGSTLREISPDIAVAPISVLYGIMGNGLVALLILLIVLLALNNLRTDRGK